MERTIARPSVVELLVVVREDTKDTLMTTFKKQ